MAVDSWDSASIGVGAYHESWIRGDCLDDGRIFQLSVAMLGLVTITGGGHIYTPMLIVMATLARSRPEGS